jgi:hypothetical protein
VSADANANALPQLEAGRVQLTQRSEARLFALSILRDKIYRENFLAAARARRLAPAVEVALMAYGWGKPTEHIEVGPVGSFNEYDDLPTSALAERSRLLTSVLEAQAEAEATGEDPTVEAERRTDGALRISDVHNAQRQLRDVSKMSVLEAVAAAAAAKAKP